MLESEKDLIYTSQNFFVERASQPFFTRLDGGHIRVVVKDLGIESSQQLPTDHADELSSLLRILRVAIMTSFPKTGIPVVWINTMELGNWAFKRNERPRLHVHIFGRTANAQYQKWPEAPHLPDRSSGFYEGFEPLTGDDMSSLRVTIDEVARFPQFTEDAKRIRFIE